jgi:hypothetical protein
MRKCTNIFTIYEEVIYDFAPDPFKFSNIAENLIFFFFSVLTVLRNNPEKRELANVRFGYLGFCRSINDMGNGPKKLINYKQVNDLRNDPEVGQLTRISGTSRLMVL